MPGTVFKRYDNSGEPDGTERSTLTQLNQAILDNATDVIGNTQDVLLAWLTGGNSTANPMARGSTDTQVGFGKMNIAISGIGSSVAASAGGTTFSTLGTIPASTWGLIAIDIIAAGTVTFVSAVANYTTGYATEAAAIAANPVRTAGKARMGYITILASASTWIAATDALAGGSSGNPATTTNYYPVGGVYTATGQTVINGVVQAGGANGVLIPTVLTKGGTDTNLTTAAFTYNANGINNLAKAVVTAGTAFGALGTIPASKWGLIVGFIDATGTISYQSAPSNYTTGYSNQTAAINDLPNVTIPAGKCQFGYITIQASASTWVAGTDALAGGSSGNPASQTGYFPNPGVVLTGGYLASPIGNMQGIIIL